MAVQGVNLTFLLVALGCLPLSLSLFCPLKEWGVWSCPLQAVIVVEEGEIWSSVPDWWEP